MEDAVNGKSARTGRRVYQALFDVRVEHLHGHVYYVTRREVLALLCLADLDGQVLESFVYHLEIGVE